MILKYKSYKYRIYPNKDQIILLSKVFGCNRKLYNLMVNDYLNNNSILAIYIGVGHMSYPNNEYKFIILLNTR